MMILVYEPGLIHWNLNTSQTKEPKNRRSDWCEIHTLNDLINASNIPLYTLTKSYLFIFLSNLKRANRRRNDWRWNSIMGLLAFASCYSFGAFTWIIYNVVAPIACSYISTATDVIVVVSGVVFLCGDICSIGNCSVHMWRYRWVDILLYCCGGKFFIPINFWCAVNMVIVLLKKLILKIIVG